MNRKKYILLLGFLLIIMLIIGCNESREVEEIRLYPAYDLVGNTKKWGFIDSYGKFKIKPKYDTVNEFEEGLAIISLEGFFGVINTEGIEILKPEFISVGSVENGYFSANRNKKIGLYHRSGPIILDEEYSSIGNYSDGYFVVTKKTEEGTKFGYIDTTGKEVIRPKYDLAYNFFMGKAIVKLNGKFKVIDKKGKIAKSLDYKEIKESDEKGKYIFSENSYDYGVINQEGNLLIKPIYFAINEIRKDKLVVTKKIKGSYKKGVVDFNGDIIIDFKYSDILFLDNDFLIASVRIGDFKQPVYNVFDEKGTKISKREYYNIKIEGWINQNSISVSTGFETFLIDKSGNPLKNSPIVKGMGEIYTDGVLFKTLVDDNLLYYNMNQEIVWEADRRFYIGDSIQVIEKEYKEDKGVDIKYPYIIGLRNRELQMDLNNRLYEYFIFKNGNIIDFKNYRYYKVSYKLAIENNILSIYKNMENLDKKNNKKSSIKAIYNIDIYSGDEYLLGDIIDRVKFDEFNEFVDILLNGEKTNNKYLSENDFFAIKNGKMYIIIKNYYDTKNLSSDREVFIKFEELKSFISLNSDIINKLNGVY